MISKIIYFPIEIKKREFDSRCYQALKLINEGFKIAICTKSALNQYRQKIKPGLVYFKSSGPRYFNLMKEFKRMGHQNIMMDEEGLLFRGEELYAKRFNKENFKYIDFILTWGKKDFSAIKKMSKSSLIFPIGSPRIDLLNQKTNQMYFHESKKIKKKYGRFVLLNTQLIFINHYTHKDKDSFIENVKNKKDYKYNEKELNLAKQRVKIQKKLFDDYKIFLEIFSKKFPKYKLIVRPHPAENHEVWKEIIKKYKNIIYVQDTRSACSWMLASQFSISANCTTAIESFFLNKFNINYRPLSNPEIEYQLPRICGLNIKSINNLIKFIKKNYHKSNIKINYFTNKSRKILQNKVSNFDGSCSVNKLNQVLASNLIFNKEKFPNKEKIVNLNYFHKLKNFVRIQYLNFKLKVLKSENSLFAIQKIPSITEKEIFDRITLFKNYLGIKTRFSVIQDEPGMFVIRKIN